MRWRKHLGAALLGVAVIVGACTEEEAEDVGRQVGEATEDAVAAAQDAWATLRTDADRLVDEIKTGDDSQAKEELLERCRNAVEKLRKAESDQAERLDEVCDRIRDMDPSDNDTSWDEIQNRIEELAPNR
jgi:hypothetical protein